jgi:transposase
MERRRLAAAKLLGRGLSEAEVARRVGVHRQSVNRWAKQLAERGMAGLKHPGRAGRKPRLSRSDLRRIERALKEGPEALGYPTSLWTTERVAHLIEEECGVKYHPGHVWRILKKLGWSCRRPAGGALEQDERAIAQWKKVRWAQAKKTPRGKAERSS